MKFRLISGDIDFAQVEALSQLPTVFEAAKLRIQTDKSFQEIALPGGRKAFVAGSITGIRTDQNKLSTARGTLSTLQSWLTDLSFQEFKQKVEGRYVVILAAPDGSCVVWSDVFGKRDIYYQKFQSALIMASDLTMLPVAKSSQGYNQPALVHMLTVYGYRPPKKHTIYEGVFRLGVTEIANLTAGTLKFGHAEFKPVRATDYSDHDHHRYADYFLECLEASGSRHGNIVFLSSGWDSSSILAGLVHVFGANKVRAVIGRMKYATRSGIINPFEIERAKAIADYYKIKLEIVEFDYTTKVPPLLEILQPQLRAQNISNFTCLSHGLLSEYVAKNSNGNETVFAGEISDGAHNLGFSQYASIFHPVLEFREYSDKMAGYLFGPTFFKTFMSGKFEDDLIYKIFRDRAGNSLFDKLAPDPAGRAMQFLSSLLLRGNRIPLWSMRNNKLINEAAVTQYHDQIEKTYLGDAANGITADPDSLYSWILHLYNSFHWQGSTVSTLPLTAEHFGLNIALPFWDSRIQDFLSGMPEQWGRGLEMKPTKYPLKWMLQNRIDYPTHLQVGPHSYLYDVDHTFSHAVEALYGSAMNPMLTGLFKQRSYEKVLSAEYFDIAYIDRLAKEYVAGTVLGGSELNDLFSVLMLMLPGTY